jgi:hypothetical protein
MQRVLTDLGINVGRAKVATGGPFVPVKLPQSEASAFERELDRIDAGRAQMGLYNRRPAAVSSPEHPCGDRSAGRLRRTGTSKRRLAR